jgi:hypothetical protein
VQDQINELKIAMATQQTIESARWQQVSDMLTRLDKKLDKQESEIVALKTQLAQGSGAIKLIMVAGTIVALLIGLSKLLPANGG